MTCYDTELEDRLPHLRPRKRWELAFIAKILFEEFEKAHANKVSEAAREGRILKLILFGSYARGGWVEDRKSGYFSDYDLLVVVNNEKSVELKFWHDAEERLLRERLMTKRIKTPVELIVHSYPDINNQLAVGRPFFLDIMRDGIVLYEAKGSRFVKPGAMTAEQKHKEARKYFDEWHELSLADLALSKISFDKSQGKMNAYMKNAAFLAHQATEHIYICLLLCLTLYSPKSHNIKHLRSLATDRAPELISVWPQDKRAYNRNFELLRRAYVEARYSPQYVITAGELQWLYERIEDLQERTKKSCEAHLRK